MTDLFQEPDDATPLQPHDRQGLRHFVCTLHKQMFGDVWSWAGDFRSRDVNIGNVQAHRIPVDLPAMLDDVKYWVGNRTFVPDEIAVRLHHRLVEIHPFPNGNGRHARLMADLLIGRLDGQPFSWGSGSLNTVGELRKRYVEALKMADSHDVNPLIQFARS